MDYALENLYRSVLNLKNKNDGDAWWDDVLDEINKPLPSQPWCHYYIVEMRNLLHYLTNEFSQPLPITINDIKLFAKTDSFIKLFHMYKMKRTNHRHRNTYMNLRSADINL